ncbi:MAG: histidine phosphotransferase family protein [Alphaproteobacteria bacterium]
MDDLRLAALLSSRLCHDLVGPASAVVNGLELLEGEATLDREAMAMIASSAGQVANRLQFFRGAFGVASGLTFVEARRVASLYFEGGKIVLDWPEGDAAPPFPAGAAKVLLNMLLLAADLLGRGGTLRVAMPRGPRPRLQVSVTGDLTRTEDLRLVAIAALAPDTTPRAAQPVFLRRLVEASGGSLSAALTGPDSAEIETAY